MDFLSPDFLSLLTGSATGFIFKAATWRAPQLKTKNPVRGSIFETSTYESKAGPHGGWLYQ